MSETIHWN